MYYNEYYHFGNRKFLNQVWALKIQMLNQVDEISNIEKYIMNKLFHGMKDIIALTIMKIFLYIM